MISARDQQAAATADGSPGRIKEPCFIGCGPSKSTGMAAGNQDLAVREQSCRLIVDRRNEQTGKEFERIVGDVIQRNISRTDGHDVAIRENHSGACVVHVLRRREDARGRIVEFRGWADNQDFFRC